MRTEDIIEGLETRCANNPFDKLLVNALSRLRTLQSIVKQRDELIKALDFTAHMLEGYGGTAVAARQAIAKAKGEK